jgi:hypothetical protein
MQAVILAKKLQSDTSHPLQIHLKGIVSCEIRYLNEQRLSGNVKDGDERGGKLIQIFFVGVKRHSTHNSTGQRRERHLL